MGLGSIVVMFLIILLWVAASYTKTTNTSDERVIRQYYNYMLILLVGVWLGITGSVWYQIINHQDLVLEMNITPLEESVQEPLRSPNRPLLSI